MAAEWGFPVGRAGEDDRAPTEEDPCGWLGYSVRRIDRTENLVIHMRTLFCRSAVVLARPLPTGNPIFSHTLPRCGTDLLPQCVFSTGSLKRFFFQEVRRVFSNTARGGMEWRS